MSFTIALVESDDLYPTGESHNREARLLARMTTDGMNWRTSWKGEPIAIRRRALTSQKATLK